MQFIKFFIPVLIAIFLIFSDYKFSYLNSFKYSVATLISPVYLLIDLPSKLYFWINEQGVNKRTLLNQNKRLKARLTRLKVDLQNHDALLLENQKLAKLLNSHYRLDKDKFILARVISINQSRLRKQIVIDKGDNSGVKVGQIALGSDGVLGQISHVTPWHATLLLITDPTQHIPVKNQRNGLRGISKGVASQKNKLTVRFIEPGLDVKTGDIFLSSGIGSKFPVGYPVGRVTKITKQINNSFLYIELTPIQATNKIEFVLISH